MFSSLICFHYNILIKLFKLSRYCLKIIDWWIKTKIIIFYFLLYMPWFIITLISGLNVDSFMQSFANQQIRIISISHKMTSERFYKIKWTVWNLNWHNLKWIWLVIIFKILHLNCILIFKKYINVLLFTGLSNYFNDNF